MMQLFLMTSRWWDIKTRRTGTEIPTWRSYAPKVRDLTELPMCWGVASSEAGWENSFYGSRWTLIPNPWI